MKVRLKKEIVTLGEPDVFDLPPDDDEDESAHSARGSQASLEGKAVQGTATHIEDATTPPSGIFFKKVFF